MTVIQEQENEYVTVTARVISVGAEPMYGIDGDLIGVERTTDVLTEQPVRIRRDLYDQMPLSEGEE